jgi:glycosyltransferase involved in cell wall biosynthesis
LGTTYASMPASGTPGRSRSADLAELSVVIATKNDANVLERCLASLHTVVLPAAISAEVLIVDDSSSDETVQVAAELSQRYPEVHMRVLQRSRANPGFGALVRYGIAHATGRYCVLVAPDGTDPVELIPAMVAELRVGKQMVICSRYLTSAGGASVSRRYRLYQRVYRRAIRLLLGREITDSTNGFRAFDRVFMQAIGLSSNRFSVCPEMTFKTILAGGQIGYLAGQPLPAPGAGSEKFKLSNEIAGYAAVLVRAFLHRAGLRWF